MSQYLDHRRLDVPRNRSPRCLSQVPAAGRQFTSNALLENARRRGSLRHTERWPFAHRKGAVCSSDVDNRLGALQFRVEVYAYQAISISFVTTRSQDRNNPIKAHYTLTLRRLMSYIYMEHPFLMFLDHTQRRSTVGRTPLDE